MPGVDWIPGISQLKSAFQFMTGDVHGAFETQINFVQECPTVSDITMVVQLAAGDSEGALETQKKTFGTYNNVVNGLPVVGHVKGVVHHLCGDHEGGDEALNAASRTSVVMGSGAVAAIVSGGLAAIPVGIGAGAAYDMASTLITDKPQGYLAAYEKVVKDPSAGNIFDAVCIHAGDGLAGYSGGKIANKLAHKMEMNQLKQTKPGKLGHQIKMNQLKQTKAGLKDATKGKISTLEAVRNIKQQHLDAGKFPEPKISTGEAISMGQKINPLTMKINTLQGNTATLHLKSGNIVPSISKAGAFIGGAQNKKQKQGIVKYAIPAGIIAGGSCVVTSAVITKKKDACAGKNKKQNWKKQNDKKLDFFKNIDNSFENALIHDFYAKQEAAGGGPSEEEKKSKLNNFAKKSAATTSLQTKSQYSISTKDSLKQKKNQFDREKTKNNLKHLITQRVWLHVRMPEAFNYTGAILLNHPYNGLYHSIIRHHNDWVHFIPNFETELQHLNLNDLQQISRAENHIRAGDAIEHFVDTLSELRRNNYERFLDVGSSLYNLQLDLYNFIQANVTYENYLGEGVTANNQVRVFFQVQDLRGNTQVMAVGVSSDVYAPDNEFGDDRSIRRIETVFIMPWQTFEKQKVSKLFDKQNFPFKK